MPNNPNTMLLPIRGMSRKQVAAKLKISVDDVGRIERLALAKCFVGLAERGVTRRDFLNYMQYKASR